MIDVQTIEQLAAAIRTLRANYGRGMGTMDLIRSLDIDPLTGLKGSDWRWTDFAGCDLRHVDFSECRLSFCDFTGANVEGAIFYRADLHKSTLHRALNVDLAYLTDEQLHILEKARSYDADGRSEADVLYRINRKIENSRDFSIAKRQFESIQASGLVPDRYSAGMLIGRAATQEEAWEAFDIVTGAKCELNEIVFTVLASRMRSAAAVRDVMAAMPEWSVAPGVRIYNTLLSRTGPGVAEESVLSEMNAVNIKRDNVTYDILMRRTGLHGRKELLAQLVKDGLHPRSDELNLLMIAARNEDEADEVIDIANELEISRNRDTYALLAPFKARPSAFRALVDDMIEDGLDRNVNFYMLAIERAGSFAEACFLFGRMRHDRIPATTRLYDLFASMIRLPATRRDPRRNDSPEEAIVALIRQAGTPHDIAAAELN